MDSNNSFFVSSGFCIPNFYILLTWYIDLLIKWLNHNFLMDLGFLVSATHFVPLFVNIGIHKVKDN